MPSAPLPDHVAARATARALRQRRAWRRGLSAERRAVWWLRLKGYRILAVRFQAFGAELDIVARRSTTLCFVEVRARPTLEDARLSLTPAKWQQVARGGAAFQAHHPAYAGLNVRFDAVLVAPGRWPWHLVDAWRPW